MVSRVPASTRSAPVKMPSSQPVRFTQVPGARPNQVASVARQYKCNVDGVGFDIMAYLQVTRSPDTDCCREFFGGITITNTDKFDCFLAEIEATEVDRRLWTPCKSTVPPWVNELLVKPDNYQHDQERHAGNGDELSDIQKVFQLLYGPRGRPRAYLRAAHKRELRVPVLHYISTFIVKPQWRRKGLAKHALLAYIHVLHEAFKYDYPVILSPGPIRAETRKMQQANQPVKSYGEIVRSLEKSYSTADFSNIFTPQNNNGGIMIMMRSNTIVPKQPEVLEAQKPVSPLLEPAGQTSTKDPKKTKRKVIGGIKPIQRVERRVEQGR